MDTDTSGCMDSVFWSRKDAARRSSGRTSPDQLPQTAPPQVCVSTLRLKSLLSSWQKKWKMEVWNLWLPSCYLVCSISGEHNGDRDLFRAPIGQSPQVSQCTQISGSGGLKFSLCHLSHQWAQRQDLMCSQLTHWTEGLYSVNNHSTVKMMTHTHASHLSFISFKWQTMISSVTCLQTSEACD